MPPAPLPGVAQDGEREKRADEPPAGPLPAERGVAWPDPARRRRHPTALALVGLTLLLALPLVVALGVLTEPRWYPLLDDAQTELRVRDVGTRHTPLVGLPGRIGTDAERGSHPGPLSFWAMAPAYRLLGSSSWALQAAGVVIHVVAVGACLWLARRRGGMLLVLGVAAVLLVVLRAHGAGTLTHPWNPHLPLVWWMVVVLAVWSLLDGDLPALPLAVLAGSLCAQTHVPYVGLVGGLAAVALAGLAVWAWPRRRDRTARRRLARWASAAAGLAVLMWLPPVVDQLTNSPGNLSLLWDHFASPPEDPIGVGRGVELMLVGLNVWRLLPSVAPDRWVLSESVVTGWGLLAVWAVAAVVAWRLRHRALLRLHLVLAAATGLGVISISRIFGFPWYYLRLWAYGITAFVVLAVGWTAAAAGRRALGRAPGGWATAVGGAALAGVVGLWVVLFAVDAAYVDMPFPPASKLVGEVAEPTADALEAGSVPGGGRDGRYSLTWVDPVGIGSQGFGLLLELERRGFDVGYDVRGPGIHRVGATRHRLIEADDATAEVHLAIGLADMERWRSRADADEVAYHDPRTSEQRGKYEGLRTQVVEGLEEAGLSRLVARIDRDLFQTSLDPRVPRRVQVLMARMLELGLPAAVFVAPSGGS